MPPGVNPSQQKKAGVNPRPSRQIDAGSPAKKVPLACICATVAYNAGTWLLTPHHVCVKQRPALWL